MWVCHGTFCLAGELQLRNAKAGALGVVGTTLDFVEVTGVLDWLRLVHDGLPRIIRPHRVAP